VACALELWLLPLPPRVALVLAPSLDMLLRLLLVPATAVGLLRQLLQPRAGLLAAEGSRVARVTAALRVVVVANTARSQRRTAETAT
jgi:hypothetical protein